jgi:hemerythrin-like metal-binding protein
VALVEWTDQCSVNVETIDNQHKTLFKIINTLYDMVNDGADKDNLRNVFNELAEYTKVHFKTEEDYFDKFNYLESRFHKYMHQEFTKVIKTFDEGFDMNYIHKRSATLSFLNDWLINHVLEEDKKYIKCFNKNGLK